ncbi:MAG: hypothetical protein Q9191_002972, partial [Dirinaria sp. TL-2023a]
MTARSISDGGSPPTPNPILPQLRRSRPGSVTSLDSTPQIGKGTLAEALDHIHSTASQSEALTTFNEYTSPPSPSSGLEGKGITSDLQGGLSGLYNRFRASVGNVRDIVTLSGEDIVADDAVIQSPRLAPPTPTLAHNLQDPVKSPIPSIHVLEDRKSVHGSRQSSRGAATAEAQAQNSSRGPRSPNTASGGSNSSPRPPLKSPVNMAAPASSAASPAVAEVNVNAVKERLLRDEKSTATPNIDSAQLANQSITSRTEASLSSTATVGQRKPPSIQSRARDRPEAKEPQLHSPNIVVSMPNADAIDEPVKGERNETVNLKPARSNRSSVDDNISQKHHTSLPNAHEHEKAVLAPTRSDNGSSPPINTANPATPQESLIGVSRLSEAVKELPNIATDIPQYQHVEIPIPRSIQPQPTSRSRTPDVSLTRASSEVTSTNLVYASAQKAPITKNVHQDLKSSTTVLSQARSKVLNKEYWMRDENARDCFNCGDPFSTFRRKHHCKLSDESSIPTGGLRPRHGSTGATDALGSPIPRSNPSFDDLRRSPMQQDRTAPTMAIPAARKAGGDSNRRPPVLEIGVERTLTRPSSSRSLKSSFANRPFVSGHRRHHSRHLTQRGFKPINEDSAPFHQSVGSDKGIPSRLPAFHDDNIIDPDLAPYLSDDESSGDEHLSIMAALSGETGMSKSLDHDKNGLAGLLGSSRKGRSRMGGMNVPSRDTDNISLSSSRTTNLPQGSKRRNLSISSNVLLRPSPRNHRTPLSLPAASHLLETSEISDQGQHILPYAPTGSPRMVRSSSMRGAAAPAVELNNASLQHVRKLLRQLLEDAELQKISSWEKALVPILLQATDDVNPDVPRGDDIDIRHYVKLKRIPGGRPGDTSYVSGLVFTKNLALKSMPRNIANPNILIVTFALEYARHQQHFMSLEPVIRQEREYLQNLISRIAALRPHLLLVQRNVSGLALELLEKANIATAYNVKPSVLEAVSRCSQTRIISSVDKLTIKPAQAGTCANFYLKTYVHKNRRKTYMFLSGCAKELGCTIALRGAEEGILAKVKRITEFMVYVVYNLKLETCLMRDEFALIPSSVEIGSMKDAKNSSRKPSEAVRQELMNSDKTLTSSKERTEVPAEGNELAPAATSRSDVFAGRTPGILATEQQDENPAADDSTMPEDIPMPTFYTEMVEKHRTKILSASPFVKFMQPYLLMRAREQERRLAYLKRLRDLVHGEEQRDERGPEPQEFNLIKPEMVHETTQNMSRKVREVLHAVHDAEYDKALHTYQTQSKQWEAYLAGSINLFDPYAHQSIAVLYSVVCTVTTVPCTGPDMLALGFYNEHETNAAYEADCTLGQYVEELCLYANNVCTVNCCERKMFDHHRQYVHGDAQLSVFVEPCACRLRGLQDTILMWSKCRVCGKETQVLPMSESSWKYSFGKYLELSFWSSELHARAGVCPHDLHRDHLRYFGYRNIAVRIHHDPITLLEIVVPRARVTWKVDNDLRFRNDLFSKYEERINKFMASIKSRIKGIKVEGVIPEKANDCQQEVIRLLKKANEDHQALIQGLQDEYMNSKYYEIIPLNRAIRYTQEKVAEWDRAFADFDRDYFPSEKDIRRLAALQFKKIFLEREDSNASLASHDGTATPNPEVILEKMSKEGIPTLAPQTRNMSPEKVDHMLASVVERDGSSETSEKLGLDQYQSAPATSLPLTDAESLSTSANDLKRLNSEDVQHLDLAVSEKLSYSISEELGPCLSTPSLLDPLRGVKICSPGGTVTDEPTTQTPKAELPLQQRIEEPVSKDAALREPNPRVTSGRPNETKDPKSELKVPTPLLRTQSQPTQAKWEKSSSNFSQDISSLPQSSVSSNPNKQIGATAVPQTATGIPSKPNEKKLSERLGLGALKQASSASQSMIPRSIASRRGQSHVSNLAKHFEQLSREFEQERVRERRQRAAKNRQSRTYPMAASKPIVEIYRSVHEAVEEREPSDEDLISSDPSHVGQEESPTMADHMAHSTDAETQGEGFHAEGTTAETTEVDDKIRSNTSVHSDVEREGIRTDDEHSLMDENAIQEHHAITPSESQHDLKLDLPKHEKTSLMKMLTNFWAERSASGWQALEYPLNATDHVFADSDIIVREDEPSSLIAFALGSAAYQAKLLRMSESGHGLSCQDELVDSKESFLGSGEPVEVERSLIRSTGTHLKFQFQEGSAKMTCKVFFAEQFDALRRKCGVSERIVESLSRCLKWDSKGGKTKSVFLKTLDDRFVLKSLSPIETQAFLRFAPAYFQIMS